MQTRAQKRRRLMEFENAGLRMSQPLGTPVLASGNKNTSPQQDVSYGDDAAHNLSILADTAALVADLQ
jgi:hypothetical protein